MRSLLLLGLVFAAAAQVSRHEDNPFYDKLKAPWSLYNAGKRAEAEAGFREVLRQAIAAGDVLAQAWCHNALGDVRKSRGEYSGARDEYSQALQIYESLHEDIGAAFVLTSLGHTEYLLAKTATARQHYRAALEIFRHYGFRREEARVLGSLSLAGDPDAEKLVLEQLAIAREIGDRGQEAEALHEIGDDLFMRGKFDAAQENYARAAALYEQLSSKRDLAFVLTSQGRLHRAHGLSLEALDYYRKALQLQEEIHDRPGQVQTINAMAVAYGEMGQDTRAVELYEQALALAKTTDSDRMINFALANLASAYIDTGKAREGAEILERIADRDEDNPERRFGALSHAYLKLGRFQVSLEAATKSVELARSREDADYLPTALIQKANAESKLKRHQDALADAQESLRVIEEKRAHLAPADFMKRGFADATREAFEFTMRLLIEAHEPARAFEVAEEARSRAFLDLLATREIQPAHGDLRSLVSVPALPFEQVQATARRLHSTIVSYWVGRDATYIWVVPGSGGIHFARVELPERQLTSTMKALWNGVAAPRGEPVSPRQGSAAPAAHVWNELYRLLIVPVERWLPSQPGSLLTIEGHGPLLMLPFAALRDPNGRYMLERFELHSIPAVSLLPFTERKKSLGDGKAANYLLVASPAPLPDGPGGKPLPMLPGARSEIAAVARLLPSSSVTILQDRDAAEQRVAELAARSSVIHMATHGVIREEDPLGSFLALGRSGSGARDDGMLTAQKVYGLELHADLVFLSACRSGLGRVSGDGINGLTRAFLYAGTPSVIASLWDVSDETSGRLVTAFYRAWLGGSDKARALRSAQLHLLNALRAGKVVIRTPYGNVALGEDPVLWASFVLEGEP